jgi:hypothetical protein
MLHAWRLSFSQPETDQRLVFESPMPQDMLDLISMLRKG